MRTHQMWNDYPDLKKDLSAVLTLIDKNIRVRNKRVESTIKEMIQAGGKLLRPAYSLLCANLGPEQDKEKSIAVAAALETLHMATLIHDDVIDDSDSRHGRPTLHSTQGNNFAIYTGDYLFCVCFTILSRHSTSLSHLEFNARSMEKILSGELDQLDSRYKYQVTVKDYLSRISGKTAQLFAVSCYSGAIQSGASRYLAMRAWNMGHYIGMAFQIMDDVLDFKGDYQDVGKPIMADIRQGNYTLPLIYALKQKQKDILPVLQKKAEISDSELRMLATLIEQCNGVEKAQQLAEKYTKKALHQLSKLPNGEYKDILYTLTTNLLERKM